MSKILLIEPSKMLQHAFVLALSPEHEVEIVHDIARAAGASEAAVAIIDAAALHDRDAEIQDERSGANRHLPTIRIGSVADVRAESPDAIVLSMPFTREELRSAIARALNSGSSTASDRTENAPPATQSPRKAARTKAASRKHDSEDRRVIELVDVFEDEDLDQGARS